MTRLLAILVCGALSAPVAAEERPPGGGVAPPAPEKREGPKTVEAAEAAALAEGLKKALRAKTVDDAMAPLDAIEGKTHPDLEAPLAKLLSHPMGEVAQRAAAALGERAAKASTLWRSGWLASANRSRHEVRAAVLAAMGRVGAPLDAKQYDEVESLWRQASTAKVRIGIASYFGAIRTDKRPCRLLAEALDEPVAGAANSPTNPPASYWEAKWKLWNASKPAVQEALKAITGQTFHTSVEAKAWFQKNRKEFGFEW